jgi:hypothetical protein
MDQEILTFSHGIDGEGARTTTNSRDSGEELLESGGGFRWGKGGGNREEMQGN